VAVLFCLTFSTALLLYSLIIFEIMSGLQQTCVVSQ
jgi:hypothetical protein